MSASRERSPFAIARALVLSSSALLAACGATAEPSTAPVVVIEPPAAPRASVTPIASSSASASVPTTDVMVWESDERAARERARREHRPMLVWIRADWDAASLRQERELWTDPRVVAQARRFVRVRLDVSDVDAIASKAYAERYDVEMLPTIVLVGADGRVAAKLAGDAPMRELFGAMGAVE